MKWLFVIVAILLGILAARIASAQVARQQLSQELDLSGYVRDGRGDGGGYAGAVQFAQPIPATSQLPSDGYADALRTREGLVEDYRLAEILIARTAARRAEAMRLQVAAAEIEAQNARIRRYLCTRFCTPTPAIGPAAAPVPFDYQLPYPIPYANPARDDLTYPLPRAELDAVWRGAACSPAAAVNRGGILNLQVVPR